MAEKRKLAEAEIKIRRAPHADEGEADLGRARWHYEDDDTVDLAPYTLKLRERWRTIASAAIAAAAMTAVVTGFVLHKWYRATAVIRPISTPAVESRIAGVMGSLGGGLSGLGGLAASIGAGGNNDAEEYIAILQGFQFNLALAESHHLSKELLKPGLLSFLDVSKDPNWKIYRTLNKRFDCEYSIKTGNITLSFEAHDRQKAEKILGYYIDDLLDLLRAREVKSASSAIESLEAEASTTPDAVLRTELYGLIAKQVERKKMAQVEADFAFRVLDPPAASDRPYKPWIVVDSTIAGLLALVLVASVLLLRTESTADSAGPAKQNPQR
jgi:Chain length determinant protein